MIDKPEVGLWLDDFRLAPDEGWVHVRSVNEAIALLESDANIVEVSLDYDMGRMYWDGGSGYKVAEWMVEHDFFPRDGVEIHSLNDYGHDHICTIFGGK